MKRLTQAQSELIDAFLAEHGARVSTAQLEKDFLISEVFAAFTAPVVYRKHEAKFALCGGVQSTPLHRANLGGCRPAGHRPNRVEPIRSEAASEPGQGRSARSLTPAGIRHS